MKTMESILKREKSQLSKVIEESKKRLEKAPEGHLRIAKKKGKMEYYLKSKAYENGRYLKKSEMDIARAIVQRDYDESVLNRAERNERVRSKSEKIIADKLYSLGIPYRYEYPIILKGNVKIYPDFTILKMSEREEVYLEHLGMMDDMDYINSLLYKLDTYEKNGIYLGINLFFTYETSKNPLNTRALDDFLRKLFVAEKKTM